MKYEEILDTFSTPSFLPSFVPTSDHCVRAKLPHWPLFHLHDYASAKTISLKNMNKEEKI